MVNKVVIGEYKIINVLAISQKIHILLHFEILTWDSMGKS